MPGVVSNRCGSWSGLFMMLTTVDPVTADLARDVAVEILRRHHGDLAVGGVRGMRRGKSEQGGKAEPGDGLHGGKAFISHANARHPHDHYVTL